MRMGWRGPLPRPRVTPPPCLGDFLLATAVASPGREPTSPVGGEIGRRGVNGVINGIQTAADGPVAEQDLGRRSPWAHLSHRFRGLGQLRAGSITLGSSRSSSSSTAGCSPLSAARSFGHSSYADVAAAPSPRMVALQPRPGVVGAPAAAPRAAAPRPHAMAGRFTAARGPHATFTPVQQAAPPTTRGGGPPLFRPIQQVVGAAPTQQGGSLPSQPMVGAASVPLDW